MKRIETTRLILRQFRLSDKNDVYDYAKRDDVGPKAGWRPHKNKNETSDIIKQFIDKDDVYAVVLKETNRVIGSLGIHYSTLGSLGKVFELGYVLHPNHHRIGIMSEAIDATLNEFFFKMNHNTIYVGHFIENLPSQKLIQKMGFKWVEDIEYQSRDYGLKQTKIYRLTKLDYALLKGDKQ